MSGTINPGGWDMTDNPISEEAIEAAVEAIRRRWDLPYRSVRPHVYGDAQAALAAAAGAAK